MRFIPVFNMVNADSAKKLKRVILFIFLIWNIQGIGQTLRFSLQMGAAIPVGDFSKSNYHPENGGFAKTGIDIRFVGEKVREDNWLMGVNIGYSIFGVDEDAIRKLIYPINPDLITVETQSFQNVNIQLRGGYNFSLLEEKLDVTPFVDAGVGVFNSAYYAIQDSFGNRYVRAGDTGFGFLISPGIDVMIKVNSFVSVKLYSTYQFTNYTVSDKFLVLNPPIAEQSTSKDVDYAYRNVSCGLGVSFIF
jgi:hypothetical protein